MRRTAGGRVASIAAMVPPRLSDTPDSLPVAVSRRQIGTVTVLVGVVVALVAALANPLGIGDLGFGWIQGVGIAIGILLIIAGGMTLRSSSRGIGPPPTQEGATRQL